MENIISRPLRQNLYQEILIYASAVILLFACSQIYIPLDPIPITMQTVGIMLIALLYNTKRGLISYSIYLIIGALGVPVFSSYSSGFNTLFGPCFGYFTGFFMAIYVMNLIKMTLGMNSFAKLSINCLVGMMIIYICGISWLSLILGFKEAIIVGLIPFIFPGIIKTFILASLIRALRITK